MNVAAKTRSSLRHTAVSGYFSSLLAAHSALFTSSSPFPPASGPATGSFNGLHPKSKFLAVSQLLAILMALASMLGLAACRI
jgi:hypothetical protein